MAQLSEMLNLVMDSVIRDGDDSITFNSKCGKSWIMHYHPDCCANCSIESVDGDLEDLVGVPLLMSEEVSSDAYVDKLEQDLLKKEIFGNEEVYYEDSYTWTFYKFATIKGYVTVRWYGSSNGYYSESASFCNSDCRY